MSEQAIRIEVGHGHALVEDARSAGREAAREATRSVGAHPLSLVLVFASVRYDLREVLSGVREVTGEAPLIGASTAGEIDRGALHRSVVVAVLASTELVAHVGAAADVSADWKTALDSALASPGVAPYFEGPERWLEATRAGRGIFAILFDPGDTRRTASHGHDLVGELNRRAGGRMPVFGGAAGDDLRQEQNWVLAGDRAIPDGVALAVVETSLQFGIAAAHGLAPSDDQVVVTAACGDDVLELDGRPAAERFLELAGAKRDAFEVGRDLALASGVLLATVDAYGEHVPVTASHFTPGGGVRFMRRLAPGVVLRRLRLDGPPAGRASALALRKAIMRGGVSDAAFALVAYCALRPPLLKIAAQVELDPLAQTLGGAPLVGFQSLGEHGVTDAGTNAHANAVISLLVLGREVSREARVAHENQLLRREVEQAAAELRCTNERLQAAHAQQRALLDGIADHVWFKDDLGRYIAANEPLAQFLGRPVGDLVGRTDLELLDPERARRNREEDERVMAAGAPLRFEQEVEDSSGQRVCLEKVKVPYRDAQGRVAGTVGVARDITHRHELERLRQRSQEELEKLVSERTAMLVRLAEDLEARLAQLRLTEETLRDSEQKYRMLVRGTPNSAVFLFDADLRCALAEGTLLDSMGLGDRVLDGRKLEEEPTGAHRAAAAILRRALGGEVVEAEVQTAARYLAMRAAPVRGSDGAVGSAMLVATDVTERRRLEEQVRQAQKMEAVGRLAGGVAHDFNNILTVILGSARELRQRAIGDALAVELADEVLEAGQRAAALTRQLLAFSRQQALRPRELDVNEVLRGLVKMLRRLIGADVEIVTRLDPRLGPVLADPGQLEQVVMNLVVNARDAMPGGGRLTLETRNADGAPENGVAARPGPHAVVTVSDTGHGMEPAVLEHLFEPFFTTKEQGKGTGLGLATVFGIVKQSGGSITVRSAPGAGTTFEVYLPRVADAEAPVPAPGGAAQGSKGRETVLLVEDDPAVRAFLRRSLEAAGYRVLEASEPDAGIRLVRDRQDEIHALVTDVVMPAMAGPELATALLELRPTLRVLFVSGYTANAALRSGVLPPGQAFLQKPFAGDELVSAVRRILDAPVDVPGSG